MTTKLLNVRLSFADLFEPRPFKPGDIPKFKGTFLIKKGSANHKLVEAAMIEAVEAKFPGKAKTIIPQIKGNPNKCCFQDGDTKAYTGYQGHMALTANSKSRPTLIDREKVQLVAADGKPYSGCYVNVHVDFFAYNNTGIGVSASLKGVQFVKDGEAFGGSAPAPASIDDFDIIPEELAG